MKILGVFGLISLGGLIESTMHPTSDGNMWALLFFASLLGWSWSALSHIALRLWGAITGRKMPLSNTDPKALAAEMAALNAQISQLRDTATSFDMSFDKTLVCLDERLRRIEQQSAYAQPTIPAGRRP